MLSAGRFPGDDKPKPIAFPDPATTAIRGAPFALLPIERWIELKLASGMVAWLRCAPAALCTRGMWQCWQAVAAKALAACSRTVSCIGFATRSAARPEEPAARACSGLGNSNWWQLAQAALNFSVSPPSPCCHRAPRLAAPKQVVGAWSTADKLLPW